jgi:DNA-binding response OmpR family regulator
LVDAGFPDVFILTSSETPFMGLVPSHGAILIVDSSPDVRHCCTACLEQEGYTVITAAHPQQGLERLAGRTASLALVELRPEPADPMESVMAVRAHLPNVPVMVLTDQGSLDTAVRSVQAGVRDYLIKPLTRSVLTARVAQVLQAHQLQRIRQEILDQIQDLLQRLERLSALDGSGRSFPNRPMRPLRCGPFRLDPVTRQATRDGLPLGLSPAAFDYLLVLARYSPEPVTYQTLVQEAQGEDQPEGRHPSEVARWHVHRLRRAIGDDSRKPRYLLTVRGVGYCLVP